MASLDESDIIFFLLFFQKKINVIQQIILQKTFVKTVRLGVEKKMKNEELMQQVKYRKND